MASQTTSDAKDYHVEHGRQNLEPLKFAVLIVRRPCLVACSAFWLAILMLIIGLTVQLNSGESLFTNATDADISDVRTNEFDGLKLARDRFRPPEYDENGDPVAREETCGPFGNEVCETKNAPAQSQDFHSLWLVLEAHDDELFQEPELKSFKELHDALVTNPEYEAKFCFRDIEQLDPTGAGWKNSLPPCKQPITPINLFYATSDLSSVTKTAFDFHPNSYKLVDGVARIGLSILPQLGALLANQSASTDLEALNLFRAQQPAYNDTRDGLAVSDSDMIAAFALWGRLTLVTAQFDGKGPLRDVEHALWLAGELKKMQSFAGSVNFFFGTDFTPDHLNTKYSRAFYFYGAPVNAPSKNGKPFLNKHDRSDEQSDLLATWFRAEYRSLLRDKESDSAMDVLWFATPLLLDEFLDIILFDSLLAILSLAFVFGWLWLQTHSAFIAVCGSLEIVLSLPMAYFFYRAIFGFEYFVGLNAMTIFIVMAIGADDVFVFVDAYKQARYHPGVCKDLETRMSWTYRRAAGAMLVTSFTTAAAFAATAISPLVAVASFGVFASLTILMDFVMVITWFPAMIVIYHNYMETRPNPMCKCVSACHDSVVDDTLSPWPARIPDGETSTGKTDHLEQDNGRVDESIEKRGLEKFLAGPFATFIIQYRLYIIGFFLLMLIPVIIGGLGIESATKPDQDFPDDHRFQRIFDISNLKFESTAEDELTEIAFAWGVDGVDRDGVNLLSDPNYRGSVVLDDTFQLDPAAQRHIKSVCEDARDLKYTEFISPDKNRGSVVGAARCVLEQVYEFANSTGYDPAGSWATDGIPLAALQGKSGLVARFLKANSTDNPYGVELENSEMWGEAIGLDTVDFTVRFVTVVVDSRLVLNAFQKRSELGRFYHWFQDWIGAHNKNGPETANKAIQVANGGREGAKWTWWHTQGLYISSAVNGALFGTALAFVVVFAGTRNWIIATASMVTIASILGTVLALMVGYGWQLGTIESIVLTILAGFSVDYVVHLAHAYTHASSLDRKERIRQALDSIGVSVLSGMVTSFGAAVPLMLTTLQFFTKFGIFLMTTVVSSWLWANLFFLACMATFGPILTPGAVVGDDTVEMAGQESAKSKVSTSPSVSPAPREGDEHHAEV